MNPKLADTLAIARWLAAKHVPYLARGLWACSFVETPEVATFAIDDRWRVMVNPEFAQACAADGSLPAALVHEALHNVLRHRPRAESIGATDPKRWNVCGDCEINTRIDEIGGLALPSCGVRPKDFGWPLNLAAEEYYQHDPPQPKAAAGQKPEGCAGGSGAGAPHPAEEGLPKPGEEGAQGLGKAEGDLVRVSVAAAIKEAASRKPGSVPGGLLRWAETYGESPPVDWRTLAQARIRYATEARRGPSPTYARPSRRTAGVFVLPVYRQPQARITIVIDTSGSMGQVDLGIALATVVDACLALGTATCVACDAVAGDATTIRHVDDLRDYLRGGGGTDMLVGIERAAESRPDAIVVVTDGETPWPSAAPDVPIIVVLTRNPSHCAAPPAWAEVVQAYE